MNKTWSEGRARVSVPAWALLAVLCFASACAGSAKKVEPPPPPTPPTAALSWLPEDARVVAHVALAPFRNSALWTLWTDNEERAKRLTSFIDVNLLDDAVLGGKLVEPQAPAADGSAKPVEAEPERKQPQFVAELRGRFGAGYLQKQAAAEGITGQPKGMLVLFARKHETWAQITPELLLAFSPELTDHIVARAGQGPDVQVRKGVLYQSLSNKISFETADLAVLAEDETGLGRAALRRESARVGIGALADDVLRAGLSVDLDTDVKVTAVAETPDAPRAQKLEQSVTNTLNGLARNIIVGLLGIRPLITALKTSSDQSYVSVTGSLPQAELTPVLQKISSMLQLAASGGLGDDGAAQTP